MSRWNKILIFALVQVSKLLLRSLDPYLAKFSYRKFFCLHHEKYFEKQQCPLQKMDAELYLNIRHSPVPEPVTVFSPRAIPLTGLLSHILLEQSK